MVVLSGIVIEKWSENPVPFAKIEIGEYEFEADEEGRFSIDVSKGTMKIKVSKEHYEDSLVSFFVVANSEITIMMKPILEALI